MDEIQELRDLLAIQAMLKDVQAQQARTLENLIAEISSVSAILTREPSGEKVCLNTFGIFDAG